MANPKDLSLFINTINNTYVTVQRVSDGYTLDQLDGTFQNAVNTYGLASTSIPGFYQAIEDREIWLDGKYRYFFYEDDGGLIPVEEKDVYFYGDWEINDSVLLGNFLALRGKVSAIEKKVDGLNLTETGVSDNMKFVVSEIHRIQGQLAGKQ